MTDLRAHIRRQLDLQAASPTAAATPPAAGNAIPSPVLAAILPPCWLCQGRAAQCERPDCDRRWRLKDPLPLMTEGKAT